MSQAFDATKPASFTRQDPKEIRDNQDALRTSFEGPVEPSGAKTGQLWFDTTGAGVLKIFDGATFIVLSTAFDIGARVSHSLTQIIATGAFVSLIFDTESYDTDTMHDTSVNTNRITFNTAGKYIIGGNIEGLISGGAGAGGARVLEIKRNAAVTIARDRVNQGAGVAVSQQTITVAESFVIGDFVELRFFQNEGVNLSILSVGFSPTFWAHKVG